MNPGTAAHLPMEFPPWPRVATFLNFGFVLARKSPEKRVLAESTDLSEIDSLADGDSVNCLNCGKLVTHLSEAMEHDGSHRHHFTNPLGVSYEIRCFGSAPGCSAKDAPVLDFTWFPEFAWQAGYCIGCSRHIGWRYSKPTGSVFYGLIADMITQTE